MAVTFDLESVKGIAIAIAHGTLTLDELQESAGAIWRLPERPEIRVLWDMRDAHFSFTSTEVRGLAESLKRSAPSVKLQLAFVVSATLEFGLVRMFGMFREAEGFRTSVFRDKEKALMWLAPPGPPGCQ